MTKISKIISLLLLIVFEVTAKKSCISTCSETAFPHCGIWVAYDNAKEAAGVYLRNFGFINLTCSVNSLPKPVTIKWMFRADTAFTAVETTCASVRTVTDCKFNEVGEHKVYSTCMVNVTQLEQAGEYCTNSNIKHILKLVHRNPTTNDKQNEKSENDRTESRSVSVQVHGIQNITLPSEQQNLIYGDNGALTARICATPKPDIVWVNIRNGITVLAGHSNGNYTALPLLPVSAPSGVYAKAETVAFCYDAVLVIGRVTASDNRFKAIVRSGMFMEEKTVPAWIANLPRSEAVDRFINVKFITLLCVMLTLVVVKGAL